MKFKRTFKIIQIKILYFTLNLFKKKPTQKIRGAFYKKYPDSEYPIWCKIKADSWQVSFNVNQHHAIANFADDGNWLGSRFLIQFLLLPANIRNAFELRFKKEFITSVYELKFKRANLYEFFVKENNKIETLLYSKTGLLLRKR